MKDKIILDVFDENGNLIGKKKFIQTKKKNINEWRNDFLKNGDFLCYIIRQVAADFQHNNQVAFLSKSQAQKCTSITQNNLIPFFVYFSVRHTIPATWINDRDQFLFPNENWEKDKEFQHNCFVFALFHGQNKISAKEGINHLIPFTEKEIGAQNAFQSDFLHRFIHGKIKIQNPNTGLIQNKILFVPQEKMQFSNAAQQVFKCAKELFCYYHQQASQKPQLYLNDAALYDIKEFFQGRNAKGRMNAKSDDVIYIELFNNLKNAQKMLAEKIEPKIYEYGFLLE